jgi:hypothetical protein
MEDEEEEEKMMNALCGGSDGNCFFRRLAKRDIIRGGRAVRSSDIPRIYLEKYHSRHCYHHQFVCLSLLFSSVMIIPRESRERELSSSSSSTC